MGLFLLANLNVEVCVSEQGLKYYVGVKLVMAEPMKAMEFENRFEKPSRSDDLNAAGYHVRYVQGSGEIYDSWSPAGVFESAYLQMGESPSTVTQEMVDCFVGAVAATNLPDEKSTLVQAECLNGFAIYEVSSCVNPVNYDHDIGREIGTKRIKDKAWEFLGFVVQWAWHGLRV